MTEWTNHPGVRSDVKLSRGERAADKLRNGMGSWAFVIGALVFLGIWMALAYWDKYPYILLNLVLSCLAALQGAILLIAAKRADQVSSELAMHDYQADSETRALVVELHRHIMNGGHNHMDVNILEKAGFDITKVSAVMTANSLTWDDVEIGTFTWTPYNDLFSYKHKDTGHMVTGMIASITGFRTTP